MVERRERRRLRELGVRALYQAEVVGEDVSDALANVLAHARKVSERGREYLAQVLRAFDEHRAVIDAALESQSEHWTLRRMAATDRNVLRWAAAELWYRPEVPRAVVLDEAIELAKELSGPESGKFVNGILDRLPASPPEDLEPVEETGLTGPKQPATGPADPPQGAERVAIISDIHGNLEALEAVLADVDALGIRRVFCLGDIVGYGASPAECCARVAAVAEARVLGNHDEACLGRGDLEYFNSVARTAALWTRERLDPAARAYLEGAPMTHSFQAGPFGVLLVHASPDHPAEWHYVISEHEARLAFEACGQTLIFVGHSHVAGVFTLEADRVSGERPGNCSLEPGRRYLVNVGSVGQPRDRDPEAAWCLLDPAARTVEIRRVQYDLEAAQARIRDAGLPTILAARLSRGE
jgi:transcription antitermination factor NusB